MDVPAVQAAHRAAERISGLVVHTPLISYPDLDERVGKQVCSGDSRINSSRLDRREYTSAIEIERVH